METLPSNIAAKAKLAGSLTSKKANNSISNFIILKAFEINIHQHNYLSTLNVIWSSLLRGWIKCNIDGVASRNMLLDACGGLFMDDKASDLLSFGVFLDKGSLVFVEFMAAIIYFSFYFFPLILSPLSIYHKSMPNFNSDKTSYK